MVTSQSPGRRVGISWAVADDRQAVPNTRTKMNTRMTNSLGAGGTRLYGAIAAFLAAPNDAQRSAGRARRLVADADAGMQPRHVRIAGRARAHDRKLIARDVGAPQA